VRAGSAPGPMHDPASGPFVVAHRGDSGNAPENTLPAFSAALDAGAPVLECDVHLSRDGVVVVIHDETVDRTTGGVGVVDDLPWDELGRLDAGYAARHGDRFRGTRIPRLEELLDLARGRAEVMIEIKAAAVGPARGGIEEATLEAARRTDMLATIGVISMEPRALRRVRAAAPAVPIGLVYPRRRRRGLATAAARLGAEFMIASREALLARPAETEAARASGLRVGAYVVEREADLRALVDAGVESIASDHPARLGRLLRALQEG